MRGQEVAVRLALPLLISILALSVVAPLRAQDKPRVYITPAATRRTEGYKGPSYNERTTTVEDRSVELSRDFSESCKEVTVSADRRKADYVMRLNRKVGRSQIAVYRTDGDLVGVAEKSSIGGAVKAACDLIKKDQPAAAGRTQSNRDPSDSTK